MALRRLDTWKTELLKDRDGNYLVTTGANVIPKDSNGNIITGVAKSIKAGTAVLQSNNRYISGVVDPEWAKFTYEEILEMEQSGTTVIPDDVLEWAHTMHTAAADIAMLDEGEQDDNADSSSPLDLKQDAINHIMVSEYKNEKMDTALEEFDPLLDEMNRMQSEIQELETEDGAEINTLQAEFAALRHKQIAGKSLSETEQSRYRQLEALLNIKENDLKAEVQDKSEVFAEVESAEQDLNKLTTDAVKYAEETNLIGSSLAEQEAKYGTLETGIAMNADASFCTIGEVVSAARSNSLLQEADNESDILEFRTDDAESSLAEAQVVEDGKPEPAAEDEAQTAVVEETGEDEEEAVEELSEAQQARKNMADKSLLEQGISFAGLSKDVEAENREMFITIVAAILTVKRSSAEAEEKAAAVESESTETKNEYDSLVERFKAASDGKDAEPLTKEDKERVIALGNRLKELGIDGQTELFSLLKTVSETAISVEADAVPVAAKAADYSNETISIGEELLKYGAMLSSAAGVSGGIAVAVAAPFLVVGETDVIQGDKTKLSGRLTEEAAKSTANAVVEGVNTITEGQHKVESVTYVGAKAAPEDEAANEEGTADDTAEAAPEETAAAQDNAATATGEAVKTEDTQTTEAALEQNNNITASGELIETEDTQTEAEAIKQTGATTASGELTETEDTETEAEALKEDGETTASGETVLPYDTSRLDEMAKKMQESIEKDKEAEAVQNELGIEPEDEPAAPEKLENNIKVYEHEMAHKEAAGSLGGAVGFEKDSGGTVTGGSVDITLPSLDKKNPEKTEHDAQTVINAAEAPSDPSGEDAAVAQRAHQVLQTAQNAGTNKVNEQSQSADDVKELNNSDIPESFSVAADKMANDNKKNNSSPETPTLNLKMLQGQGGGTVGSSFSQGKKEDLEDVSTSPAGEEDKSDDSNQGGMCTPADTANVQSQTKEISDLSNRNKKDNDKMVSDDKALGKEIQAAEKEQMKIEKEMEKLEKQNTTAFEARTAAEVKAESASNDLETATEEDTQAAAQSTIEEANGVITQNNGTMTVNGKKINMLQNKSVRLSNTMNKKIAQQQARIEQEKAAQEAEKTDAQKAEEVFNGINLGMQITSYVGTGMKIAGKIMSMSGVPWVMAAGIVMEAAGCVINLIGVFGQAACAIGQAAIQFSQGNTLAGLVNLGMAAVTVAMAFIPIGGESAVGEAANTTKEAGAKLANASAAAATNAAANTAAKETAKATADAVEGAVIENLTGEAGGALAEGAGSAVTDVAGGALAEGAGSAVTDVASSAAADTAGTLAQEITKNAAAETAKEAAKEVAAETAKEAAIEVSKEAAGETAKEAAKEVSKEAAASVAKEAAGTVGAEAGAAAGNAVAAQAGRAAGNELAQKAAKAATDTAAKEATKAASKAAASAAAKAAAQGLSAEAVKEAAQEAAKNAAKEAAKEIAKKAAKATAKTLAKEATKQLLKEAGKAAMPSMVQLGIQMGISSGGQALAGKAREEDEARKAKEEEKKQQQAAQEEQRKAEKEEELQKRRAMFGQGYNTAASKKIQERSGPNYQRKVTATSGGSMGGGAGKQPGK